HTFLFTDTATPHIYTLSYTTLFRSCRPLPGQPAGLRAAPGRAGPAPARAPGAAAGQALLRVPRNLRLLRASLRPAPRRGNQPRRGAARRPPGGAPARTPARRRPDLPVPRAAAGPAPGPHPDRGPARTPGPAGRPRP